MKSEYKRNQRTNEANLVSADHAPSQGASAFDAEAYLPYLAEFDLTDEQAAELLTALWEMMKAFVDIGFGVGSIHEILPGLKDVSPEIGPVAVEFEKDRFSAAFEKSARAEMEKEEES